MIKPTMRGLLAAVIPVLFGALAGIAQAQSAASDADSTDDSDQSTHVEHHRVRLHHGHHDSNDNNLFSVGSDSVLPAGKQADSVVAILGAAISDGDADSVVSILGSTHVTGPLSDSAVAVLGDVYVDSKIDGDAVAVLGNVELGPHAEIGGDVVAVGGKLQRDPDAILHGEAQTVLGGDFGGFDWIKPWIRHCLFLGRPLALVPGIGWAWTLALSFLGLYVLLAFLFRSGLDQCVRTFESYPGHCIVAALIAALVSPIIITLLCITVIGIAAVAVRRGRPLLCRSVRQGRAAGMDRWPVHRPPASRSPPVMQRWRCCSAASWCWCSISCQCSASSSTSCLDCWASERSSIRCCNCCGHGVPRPQPLM